MVNSSVSRTTKRRLLREARSGFDAHSFSPQRHRGTEGDGDGIASNYWHSWRYPFNFFTLTSNFHWCFSNQNETFEMNGVFSGLLIFVSKSG